MTIDGATITQLLAVVIGAGGIGGGLGAWLNHLRETRRDRRGSVEEFQTVWRAEYDRQERRHRSELARLEAKVDHLEDIVVALSAELEKAGVDPLSIRRCLRPPTKETDP